MPPISPEAEEPMHASGRLRARLTSTPTELQPLAPMIGFADPQMRSPDRGTRETQPVMARLSVECRMPTWVGYRADGGERLPLAGSLGGALVLDPSPTLWHLTAAHWT